MSAEAIGIMDPAFFVPKNTLIKWINENFDPTLKKVEDMATGSIYCQILDCIYPGKVPLWKVNFGAKYDYEYSKNWKVVQEVFNSQGVQKPVDIGKLTKAKYQDNLEFMQWMKHFFDSKYSGQAYDAEARRKESMKQAKSKGGPVSGTSLPSSMPTTIKTTPAAPKPKPKTTASSGGGGGMSGGGGGASSAELESLRVQIAEFKTTIESLETEKVFYFNKLRQIEVACQEEESDVLSKASIIKVLYQEDTEAPAEAAAETPEENNG